MSPWYTCYSMIANNRPSSFSMGIIESETEMRILQKKESMSPHIRLFYWRYFTFSNVDILLVGITYKWNHVKGYLLYANTRKDKLEYRSNPITNYNIVDLFYLEDKSIVIRYINAKQAKLGGYCDRITP